MHVMFISACEKKAIRRTRALLDSFAIRTGPGTWASPMTDEGLEEVRSALSRSATRQTAVACYQNDGRRQMRLLWIVGSKRRFGPDGQFCIGQRAAGQGEPVAYWEKLAGLVARLAGLLHDFGKYSRKFQEKLRSSIPEEWKDAIRHEWISLKLAQHLRDGSLGWDEAWQALRQEGAAITAMRLGQRPLNNEAPHSIASAQECVDAIIATHHKLFVAEAPPSLPNAQGHVREAGLDADNPLFHAHASLPDATLALAKRLWQRLEHLAQEHAPAGDDTPFWHALFLVARMAVIFADHTVSARKFPPPAGPDEAEAPFANTAFTKAADGQGKGQRALNQPLANHLHEVSALAADVVWRMARLAEQPDIHLPGLQACAEQAILRPADNNGKFSWQNTASDALAKARQEYPHSAVLLFNMAGTGCGKTRMNVRAATILSTSPSARISIALNLRSLTLQTGHALQHDLGLGDNDCATVIGDAVTTRLFQNAQAEKGGFADPWEESEILASGGSWPLPAWLEAFFVKPRERKILAAPLLVSTIDFLVAAGEPFRQGHHVKAMLRLMSSDIILDEVDAYEPESMVAVLRLVQLAGLFGRNVVCSSATLSLPVQEAVEAAFASGLDMGRSLRGEQPDGTAAPLFLRACIDNDLPPEITPVSTAGEAGTGLGQRIDRQMRCVRSKPVYRRAGLLPLGEQTVGAWQDAVLHGVEQLHEANHIVDPLTGLALSFGLVRVANIPTAIDTARFLAQKLPHARVACYHSGDWRISRFHKEQRLDFLLSRSRGDDHILNDAEVRSLLDAAHTNGYKRLIFVVVATPVEEVGRDHDFDWAVIDVSSAQSLVQTAGRVNRHRMKPVERPNIAVPQFNWRHCRNNDTGRGNMPAFCWPGYESDKKPFADKAAPQAGSGPNVPLVRKSPPPEHDLKSLLPWQDDALPVTADLRFGLCKLARFDDQAIEERLFKYYAPPHQADASAWFGACPVWACLLGSKIYLDTPLRSRTGESQTWRLVLDDGHDNVHLEKWVSNKWNAQGQPFTRITAPLTSNAWLTLTPERMAQLCMDNGIATDEGMCVDVTCYGEQKDHVLEYDKSCGIAFRKRN